MTNDLHHRRLRESRGALLRASGIVIALVGGLAGGIGLQMGGAPLQARMASFAQGMLGGRPSTTLAARGPAGAPACPEAGVTTQAPNASGASATASAHRWVHVATMRAVFPEN